MSGYWSPSLLDVDSASLCQVLTKLPGKELVRLASTCRTLRDLALRGALAERLWEGRCNEVLETDSVDLHLSLKARQLAREDSLRRLYGHATTLRDVCWYRSETCAALAAVASGRAGHSATKLDGNRVLISGGLKEEITGPLDLVVVDLKIQQVKRLVPEGVLVYDRLRHSSLQIRPSPGSPLWQAVARAVGHEHDLASGTFVAVIGGRILVSDARIPDPSILEVLWINEDATFSTWIRERTSGALPTPAWHHSADTFCGGKKLVLFGGEQHMWYEIMGSDHCWDVQILDLDTLTWHAVGPAPKGAPHSLHSSCIWREVESGDEYLVVVGGFTERSRLASMRPYVLNLKTLVWSSGPAISGGRESCPASRQRAGSCKFGNDWLVVFGGCPYMDLMTASDFLDCMWALHLPTLLWQPVRASRARDVGARAGHTLVGQLGFGGCVISNTQFELVGRPNLLLLGNSGDYKAPTA